jgi:NAD+ kinase
MTHFSSVGIVCNINNDRAVYSVKRLIHFLRQKNAAFVLEKETARLALDADMIAAATQVVDINLLGELCDLAIVVGGDGSLLRAARSLARYNVPLLGINRGRLGFLTDITPEDIENKVNEVLLGKFKSEERFLLDMEVMRNNQIVAVSDALNDVVLYPGKFIHMLQFEVYVDGLFVTSLRADGVIVATPTGSTAYSLSGGGPILHPTLDAIVVVPMNPHTLSSRPMVFPGDGEVTVVVGVHDEAEPTVTCDGHSHVQVHTGDHIVIRKKPHLLQLLHPIDFNFYERCRSKLGWGGHLLKE